MRRSYTSALQREELLNIMGSALWLMNGSGNAMYAGCVLMNITRARLGANSESIYSLAGIGMLLRTSRNANC